MGYAWLIVLALQAPDAQRDQDLAVQKGLAFLRARKPAEDPSPAVRELALWVFVGVRVPPDDPTLRALLTDILSRPPESTASAARQAIVFALLDREKYLVRILHCAQFLIDNQAADGLWGKGEPVDPVAEPPLLVLPPPGGARAFGAVAIPRKIRLQRLREGPKEGDPVNARWAAWGLHAAHSAGVIWPEETTWRALNSWRVEGRDPADALAGLCLWRFYSGVKEWKKDPDIRKAGERLIEAERPKDPQSWFVLKRTMILRDSAKLGDWEWWPDGVSALLKSQTPEGGWGGLEPTCWALLALDLPVRNR